MKKFALLCVLFTFVFSLVGCSSDPNGQAAELRALYREAQSQSAAICADKSVDPAKCAELQKRIAALEPYVAAVEVAAANTDPSGKINFQVLWNQTRPKVEAALLDIVLRKYLGTN